MCLIYLLKKIPLPTMHPAPHSYFIGEEFVRKSNHLGIQSMSDIHFTQKQMLVIKHILGGFILCLSEIKIEECLYPLIKKRGKRE